MDERYLPDWNEDALSLGRPHVMDTPTLIEWIERQLESKEETVLRHNTMALRHEEWHTTHPGVYTCCMRSMLFNFTTNERRDMESQKQLIINQLKQSSYNTIVVPEGVTFTSLAPEER